MKTELRFDGRVALVTGAGSGIGREQALALAGRGAKVLVNSRAASSKAACEDVCDEIRAKGGEATPVTGVVGPQADADAMIRTAIDTYGRIDIIINNAGTSGSETPIFQHPTETLERELDVHIRGPLRINRAAWPHMVRQGYGRILFTGSSCGLGWYLGPGGAQGDYPIAKSALFAAVRQTASAGQDHGIKANLVMPWAFTPQDGRTLGESDFSKWMRDKLRPELVSFGSLYLVHDECSVSGEFLSIAGGRMTRILFASPKGYFNPNLSPEDIRDNWQAIYGQVGDDFTIDDMVEIRGQPGEFELIKALL